MKHFIIGVLVAFSFTAIPTSANQNLQQGINALQQQDYDQAAVLFQQAADTGSPEAQFQLALLMFTGQGVAVDATQARLLMTQLSTQGHAEAEAWLLANPVATAVEEEDYEEDEDEEANPEDDC